MTPLSTLPDFRFRSSLPSVARMGPADVLALHIRFYREQEGLAGSAREADHWRRMGNAAANMIIELGVNK